MNSMWNVQKLLLELKHFLLNLDVNADCEAAMKQDVVYEETAGEVSR